MESFEENNRKRFDSIVSLAPPMKLEPEDQHPEMFPLQAGVDIDRHQGYLPFMQNLAPAPMYSPFNMFQSFNHDIQSNFNNRLADRKTSLNLPSQLHGYQPHQSSLGAQQFSMSINSPVFPQFVPIMGHPGQMIPPGADMMYGDLGAHG